MHYGFRKGRGTNDVLAMITDLIYTNLFTSKPIAVVFLDLSKVFDTVDQKKLIDKLY